MYRTVRLISCIALLVLVAAVFAQPVKSVVPTQTEPVMKVISPKTGESWEEKTTHDIVWELVSSDALDSVQIWLMGKVIPKTEPASKPVDKAGDNNKLLATLSKSIATTWTWENVGPMGAAKIEVRAFYPKGKVVKASSSLKITPATSPDTPATLAILIDSPKKGEIWKVGETTRIAWTVKTVPVAKSRFIILLSRDNGLTFEEKLGDDILSTVREHKWVASGAVSKNCVVKIELYAKGDTKPLATALSDPFQIVE